MSFSNHFYLFHYCIIENFWLDGCFPLVRFFHDLKLKNFATFLRIIFQINQNLPINLIITNSSCGFFWFCSLPVTIKEGGIYSDWADFRKCDLCCLRTAYTPTLESYCISMTGQSFQCVWFADFWIAVKKLKIN